ncbi:MAG: hypothetical protein ACRDCI_11885 [Plesiomonas shigelloides]
MQKPSTPAVWASSKAFSFTPNAQQIAQGFDYIATIGRPEGAPITDDHDWPFNQVTAALKWIMDQLPEGGLKYGCPLVGSLIHWPLQQMPQEVWPDCGMVFIPYIAQAFDPVKYPLLKIIHPSGFLPADMRGEFPRGWDNGRMVDPDRVLMSAQGDAIRNVTGKASAGDRSSFSSTQNEPTEGAFTLEGNSGNMTSGAAISTSYPCLRTLRFDASRVVPTAKENRPRNIAWNMIVRAA